MANEQNLKPFRKGELSSEEAKKRGSAGGKRSAAVRKENRIIKDEILKRMGQEDWDEYIQGIIDRAKENKADAEFLRDTIGQKPKDEVSLDANMVFEVEINEDQATSPAVQ